MNNEIEIKENIARDSFSSLCAELKKKKIYFYDNTVDKNREILHTF